MKREINGETQLKKNDLIKKAKRIVIKIGTNVLTTQTNRLDTSIIEHLVEQITYLIEKKEKEIIIVTSGAILSGMQVLNWEEKPKQINELQAVASIGQGKLMGAYERIFKEEGINVGQILLTRDIFMSKKRAKIARETILTLLKHKIVPIINENDSVAFEDIKFGDNDILSAYVTNLIEADILILITDVDGLYKNYSDKKGGVIREVKDIEKLENISFLGKTSRKGTGGMKSKIQAANIVTKNGKPCLIINGKKMWTLKKTLDGKEIGTFFYPARQKNELER